VGIWISLPVRGLRPVPSRATGDDGSTNTESGDGDRRPRRSDSMNAADEGIHGALCRCLRAPAFFAMIATSSALVIPHPAPSLAC